MYTSCNFGDFPVTPEQNLDARWPKKFFLDLVSVRHKQLSSFWEISPIFSVGFDFSSTPDAKTTSERIVVFSPPLLDVVTLRRLFGK